MVSSVQEKEEEEEDHQPPRRRSIMSQRCWSWNDDEFETQISSNALNLPDLQLNGSTWRP